MVVLAKFLDVIMRQVPSDHVPLAEVSLELPHRKLLGRLLNTKESVLLYLLGKYVIDFCPKVAAIKTIFQV
jgi:hypothetical protein